ncbi:MAG: hypothetical protein NVS3B7_09310 [Candidatus Elarobacter sp.]
MCALRNLRTGVVLAWHVCVAETPGARHLQLLSRDIVLSDDGIWLDGCTEMDTFGMRVAIDIVFLDGARRVLATYRRVPPNHRSIRCAQASSVLQLGVAQDRDVRHGDVLTLD